MHDIWLAECGSNCKRCTTANDHAPCDIDMCADGYYRDGIGACLSKWPSASLQEGGGGKRAASTNNSYIRNILRKTAYKMAFTKIYRKLSYILRNFLCKIKKSL